MTLSNTLVAFAALAEHTPARNSNEDIARMCGERFDKCPRVGGIAARRLTVSVHKGVVLVPYSTEIFG
jgi:hypothetical protein